MKHKTKLSMLAISAAAVTMIVAPAMAQQCDWKPKRAVTYIVPWSAGGGTDASARTLATLLSAKFGVPFNVINRAGGNGVTGHTALAIAPHDGYTIGSVTTEIATMHYVGLTKITYRDFSPIALIDLVPAGVIVAADSQFKTLKQLLDYAKANPGKLTSSGGSAGSSWQLALTGLLNSVGMKPNTIRWIPSQGAAPGLQELLSGGVDMTTNALAEAESIIKSGQARALVYMDNKNNKALPDVPTVKQAVGTDWTLASFQIVAAPKGLSDNIACSYEKAIEEVTKTKQWADFKASRASSVVFEGRKAAGERWQKADQNLGAAMKAIGMATSD